MKVAELKEMAKQKGIPYTNKKKSDLIKSLLEM